LVEKRKPTPRINFKIDPMPRYFANTARNRPRLSPGELPGAIGVLSDPSKPGDIIGIAYAAGYLGGWLTVFDGPNRDWQRDSVYLGKPETTWRLVVGKGEGKVEVNGRFVLRMGEFVGLAEDAV
jgi:hypothetical protein